MYVMYKDGVYRHDTVAFSLDYEGLLPKMLEFFEKEDDYHCLTVEHLNLDSGAVEDICQFRQSYECTGILIGAYKRNIPHGKATIYKDAEVFCTYDKVYVLREGESFV